MIVGFGSLSGLLVNARTAWPNEHFAKWAGNWTAGKDRSIDAAESALKWAYRDSAPDYVLKAISAVLHFRRAAYEAERAAVLLEKLPHAG